RLPRGAGRPLAGRAGIPERAEPGGEPLPVGHRGEAGVPGRPAYPERTPLQPVVGAPALVPLPGGRPAAGEEVRRSLSDRGFPAAPPGRAGRGSAILAPNLLYSGRE